MRRTVTRKQIADAADVSQATVRRREQDWGLDKCRSKATVNPATYFTDRTNEELLRRGIIRQPIVAA